MTTRIVTDSAAPVYDSEILHDGLTARERRLVRAWNREYLARIDASPNAADLRRLLAIYAEGDLRIEDRRAREAAVSYNACALGVSCSRAFLLMAELDRLTPAHLYFRLMPHFDPRVREVVDRPLGPMGPGQLHCFSEDFDKMLVLMIEDEQIPAPRELPRRYWMPLEGFDPEQDRGTVYCPHPDHEGRQKCSYNRNFNHKDKTFRATCGSCLDGNGNPLTMFIVRKAGKWCASLTHRSIAAHGKDGADLGDMVSSTAPERSAHALDLWQSKPIPDGPNRPAIEWGAKLRDGTPIPLSRQQRRDPGYHARRQEILNRPAATQDRDPAAPGFDLEAAPRGSSGELGGLQPGERIPYRLVGPDGAAPTHPGPAAAPAPDAAASGCYFINFEAVFQDSKDARGYFLRFAGARERRRTVLEAALEAAIATIEPEPYEPVERSEDEEDWSEYTWSGMDDVPDRPPD